MVAHELPDILDRAEFLAFDRVRDDADIAGHVQLPSHMPTGLINHYNSVSAMCDGDRDFGQVERHSFGIAQGQNQPCALVVLRADCAEDIDRFGPLIFGRTRPYPAPGPAPRYLVLLRDPRFVLEPDLYKPTLREKSSDLCQLGFKALFLNTSIASSFWAWRRGRAVSLT